jgi:hypothetical protein
MIYGPVNDNGIWRTRYNKLLCIPYNELDIVKVIKLRRLMWLGLLCRMQELDSCRKLTVLKPEGSQHVGKPKLYLSQLRKN